MESQPKNSELMNNPKNLHQCKYLCFVFLFDSLCPISNLSVKQGRIFLG